MAGRSTIRIPIGKLTVCQSPKCGKLYTCVRPGYSSGRLCSKRCAQQYNGLQQVRKTTLYDKVCPNCGKQFKTDDSRHTMLYCLYI